MAKKASELFKLIKNPNGPDITTWPGTLGIAAAVKGSGIEVADKWAEATRQSWEACNLRKGYMYMVDCMSDPRWQRSYGTFGEDPALICEIAEHIIPRIQGSEAGVTKDGVAVTTKHFPGGGPRENGFDPHYAAGQWNVYATPGSLQKYHMPGFKSAVAKNTSSIMPYYSKPAAAKSAVQQDCEGNDVRFDPTGKLPITLPKGDEVLAVNEEGVCISPNDVPSYDKDQYMPAELKDENGKAYAYRDAAGNYYELNFGLSY